MGFKYFIYKWGGVKWCVGGGQVKWYGGPCSDLLTCTKEVS